MATDPRIGVQRRVVPVTGKSYRLRQRASTTDD